MRLLMMLLPLPSFSRSWSVNKSDFYCYWFLSIAQIVSREKDDEDKKKILDRIHFLKKFLAAAGFELFYFFFSCCRFASSPLQWRSLSIGFVTLSWRLSRDRWSERNWLLENRLELEKEKIFILFVVLLLNQKNQI